MVTDGRAQPTIAFKDLISLIRANREQEGYYGIPVHSIGFATSIIQQDVYTWLMGLSMFTVVLDEADISEMRCPIIFYVVFFLRGGKLFPSFFIKKP